MAEAELHRGNAHMIDYTPSGTDVAAGEVILINSQAYVAHRDIADGEDGSLSSPNGSVEYRFAKEAGVAIALGAPFDWDAGTNVAVATTGGDGHVGYCSLAAGANDDHVYGTLERKGA